MATITQNGKTTYRVPLTRAERDILVDTCVRDRMEWCEHDPAYLHQILSDGYVGFDQLIDVDLLKEYEEVLREKGLDQ
jgi:hypothetical protein